MPPDSDPHFHSLWTRSTASLTYWQWVVVYEQETLRLWLTDNGLLSMNKKHCSLTYWQWVVVYEQEALRLWLTDNGLLSMNKRHCSLTYWQWVVLSCPSSISNAKQLPPFRQPCAIVSLNVHGFLWVWNAAVLETGAAVVGRGVAGVLPHPSVTNTQQHEYRHSTFLCMFVEFVSYPRMPVRIPVLMKWLEFLSMQTVIMCN